VNTVPGTGTMKHQGLKIYGICNKLVSLSKIVCFVTGNRKDTSLLWNLYICHKLQIRNVS